MEGGWDALVKCAGGVAVWSRRGVGWFRGEEGGGNAGAERGTPEKRTSPDPASRGAGRRLTGDAEGKRAGRRGRRRRRGVARVARAHLFRVGGARSGCARGEARRRGRVPLRVRRALTGRGEDVDRSFPFGARVSAVEQRV